MILLIAGLVAGNMLAFPVPGYAAGPVAVFLSSDEDAYARPAEAFVSEIRVPVRRFNLHGDIRKAPEIMGRIFSENPCLIFALGAKAAYIAKSWTKDRPNLPVIFAMVLNWKKYDLLNGQKNIAGIDAAAAPGTQFANMSMFFPNVRRIGVIYSKENSSEIIASAKSASMLLGLELVPISIRRPKDFREAYETLAGRMDAFWIVTDPIVYTVDNMSWLQKKSVSDRLISVGQSKNIAKLGILLAVNPDIPTIGSQAASMAKNILSGRRTPMKIRVRPPLGTRISLNMKTARHMGLVIDPSLMDMANEIIGE